MKSFYQEWLRKNNEENIEAHSTKLTQTAMPPTVPMALIASIVQMFPTASMVQTASTSRASAAAAAMFRTPPSTISA